MDVPRFNHSPTEGRFGYFQFLAITNKAVVNILVKKSISGLHSVSFCNILFSLNLLFLSLIHADLIELGPL